MPCGPRSVVPDYLNERNRRDDLMDTGAARPALRSLKLWFVIGRSINGGFGANAGTARSPARVASQVATDGFECAPVPFSPVASGPGDDPASDAFNERC